MEALSFIKKLALPYRRMDNLPLARVVFIHAKSTSPSPTPYIETANLQFKKTPQRGSKQTLESFTT
jgi:hypothetical protein